MMDTYVEVSVWGKCPGGAEAAVERALAGIARVDSMFGDGVVSSEENAEVLETKSFHDVLEMSRRAHALTAGKFDPTIGAVSSLWDFWEGARVPPADSIDQALRDVGLARYLEGKAGRYVFDLGGVAKGYAVDLAAETLDSIGVRSAIINAGGDLRLIGRRADGEPWRIAIRHPRRPGGFIGYLEVENVAVATSGDYEQCFFRDGRRYHHILDPATGMPGEGCNSVTVVAPTACMSDALATGLFLLGPERGLAAVEAQGSIEAVFVCAEGESVAVSTGLVQSFERSRD